MPLPRGRKSLPTMFSRTEDLPEDCEPTTTCTGQYGELRMLWHAAAELSPASSAASHVPRWEGQRTIWGRSRESLPMVLKTRSWSLLTMLRSSSPSDAITLVDVCGFGVPGTFGLQRSKQQRPRWLRDGCSWCAGARNRFWGCREATRKSGTWMPAGLGLRLVMECTRSFVIRARLFQDSRTNNERHVQNGSTSNTLQLAAVLSLISRFVTFNHAYRERQH